MGFFFSLLDKKKSIKMGFRIFRQDFSEGARLSSMCVAVQGKECLGGNKMSVFNTICL